MWIQNESLHFRQDTENRTGRDSRIILSNNVSLISAPQIAATDNGNVYLVWIENGFNFKEIVSYGNIMGQTIILSNSSEVMEPKIAVSDDGNVYLGWMDKKSNKVDEIILLFKHLSSTP